jgi:hypothetical protein
MWILLGCDLIYTYVFSINYVYCSVKEDRAFKCDGDLKFLEVSVQSHTDNTSGLCEMSAHILQH